MTTNVEVRVKWGKKVLIFNASSIAELKTHISASTEVPIDRCKLIFKGELLVEGPLTQSLDVTLVGSSEVLPSPMPEDDTSRLRKYAHKREYRPEQPEYRFHDIQTLPGFSDAHMARGILTDLANDPGVLAVLKKHRWSVGALCELPPEGQVGVDPVCVLGLNKNKGQQILLRLRTDDLKGFRKRLTIRKVLYHELAHNVHSDHDGQFYMLMSQVEKEATSLDWRQGAAQQLGGPGAGHPNEGPVFRTNEAGRVPASHRLGAEGEKYWDAEASPAENARIAALVRLSQSETCMDCVSDAEAEVAISSEAAPLPEQEQGSIETESPVASAAVLPVTATVALVQISPPAPPLAQAEEEAVETPPVEAPPVEAPPAIMVVGEEVYERVVTSLDETIAVAMLGSGVEDRLGKMREAIATFLQGRFFGTMAVQVLIEAAETVETILKIVSKARSESHIKYKSVKASSARFIRVIRDRRAAPILAAAGFEEDAQADAFVLKRNDPGLGYLMEGLLSNTLEGIQFYIVDRE